MDEHKGAFSLSGELFFLGFPFCGFLVLERRSALSILSKSGESGGLGFWCFFDWVFGFRQSGGFEKMQIGA